MAPNGFPFGSKERNICEIFPEDDIRLCSRSPHVRDVDCFSGTHPGVVQFSWHQFH